MGPYEYYPAAGPGRCQPGRARLLARTRGSADPMSSHLAPGWDNRLYLQHKDEDESGMPMLTRDLRRVTCGTCLRAVVLEHLEFHGAYSMESDIEMVMRKVRV